MAWVIAWQGPVGMKDDLTGPADIALSLASYLLPLLVYEIYRQARNSASLWMQMATVGLMGIATIVIAGGIAGATLFLWFPAG